MIRRCRSNGPFRPSRSRREDIWWSSRQSRISAPLAPASLHTNFKISSGGETLVLTAPVEGRWIRLSFQHSPRTFLSGSSISLLKLLRYFKPATPGSANIGPGFEGIMLKPSLTVNPGYFATRWR